jgi:hypothetical protein
MISTFMRRPAKPEFRVERADLRVELESFGLFRVDINWVSVDRYIRLDNI